MLSQQLGSFLSLVPLSQGPALGLLLYEGNDEDESFVRPCLNPDAKEQSKPLTLPAQRLWSRKCKM